MVRGDEALDSIINQKSAIENFNRSCRASITCSSPYPMSPFDLTPCPPLHKWRGGTRPWIQSSIRNLQSQIFNRFCRASITRSSLTPCDRAQRGSPLGSPFPEAGKRERVLRPWRHREVILNQAESPKAPVRKNGPQRGPSTRDKRCRTVNNRAEGTRWMCPDAVPVRKNGPQRGPSTRASEFNIVHVRAEGTQREDELLGRRTRAARRARTRLDPEISRNTSPGLSPAVTLLRQAAT
jgi:hypothetical protein